MLKYWNNNVGHLFNDIGEMNRFILWCKLTCFFTVIWLSYWCLFWLHLL